MTQSTNNPVILMIKPDSIQIQEIKVLPAKAKVQDMVAIRHIGSTVMLTSEPPLFCSSSLRNFMANVEQTNYWMSPALQPHIAITVLRPTKKKRLVKTGRPSNQLSFRIDFLEHCTQTNDVQFGGNDVFKVYNTSQITKRLHERQHFMVQLVECVFRCWLLGPSTLHMLVCVCW
jgi:E3 ubiquitin-protein ligase UBR4